MTWMMVNTGASWQHMWLSINSATSSTTWKLTTSPITDRLLRMNNMKMVHWLLMGGLLHLVQREGDWVAPQSAHATLCCTKCNSPPINGQCTNQCTSYCCITVHCCAVSVQCAHWTVTDRCVGVVHTELNDQFCRSTWLYRDKSQLTVHRRSLSDHSWPSTVVHYLTTVDRPSSFIIWPQLTVHRRLLSDQISWNIL